MKAIKTRRIWRRCAAAGACWVLPGGVGGDRSRRHGQGNARRRATGNSGSTGNGGAVTDASSPPPPPPGGLVDSPAPRASHGRPGAAEHGEISGADGRDHASYVWADAGARDFSSRSQLLQFRERLELGLLRMKSLLMVFFPLLFVRADHRYRDALGYGADGRGAVGAGGSAETDSGSVDAEGMGGERGSGRLYRAVEGRGG